MDHTQAYFYCFTKTHAHVHLCRCQQACIEQSEQHTLTVCPCEDEGRTMQRKDGGSNAALPDSKSCANGWRSSKDLSRICGDRLLTLTLTLVLRFCEERAGSNYRNLRALGMRRI